MTSSAIQYSETRDLLLEEVLTLYRANGWSSAEKPDLLHKALLASHSLATAWEGDRLVGIGNAISDGHLVVYYSHLLVLPEYSGTRHRDAVDADADGALQGLSSAHARR